MGIASVGETPSLTGEILGETHRVFECTQAHPLGKSVPEGPNLLVEVTESGQRAEQVALFPLGPLSHKAVNWVALPWQIPNTPPCTV